MHGDRACRIAPVFVKGDQLRTGATRCPGLRRPSTKLLWRDAVAPHPTKVAGLVLAWLASNLAWTLFGGFVGALISAILKDKGVFENTYGLVAIGLLVAAVLANAPR